uniref:Uncharacterized protein n=1 Tax=Vitis vinifera TaxID=29760 RepID=F6GTE1_VITVI
MDFELKGLLRGSILVLLINDGG